MRTTTALAFAVSALLVSACTADPKPAAKEVVPPRALATLNPAASLTAEGVDLLGSSDFESAAPRVDVTASVDPATGKVKGKVAAQLPVGQETPELHLRYFAGLLGAEADVEALEPTIDGKDADAAYTDGLITISLPEPHERVVALELPFAYTVPEAEGGSILDALGGGSLEPAEIGLLSRHATTMSLGHWVPTWIPNGRRDDAKPTGFGDIANFAAADLSITLTVPEAWTVIDTGVRVEEGTDDGRTTITSYGTGMREISVVIAKDYETVSRKVGDVTVHAWGPESAKGELDGVLDETATSIQTLSDELGAYPWKQFDVVSAPLGAGVSGMEWPGGTWIEPGVFAGGLPGLGSIGDLLGGLGDLGSLGGELGGDLGLMFDTIRPWTIAHEVGHMWWTILVGNDSIADPVVDEPLAQYSACLVARKLLDDAAKVCQAQIASGYSGLPDGKDAKADQATDQFESAPQYGALIYGKAAWFYLALEKAYDAERVRGALRQVVADHAFETVTPEQLRAELVSSLDEQAGTLWDRWMQETHGAEDMPKVEGLGGLGGLDDLLGGEGDLGDIEGLLEQLGMGEGELDPEMIEKLLEIFGQLAGGEAG